MNADLLQLKSKQAFIGGKRILFVMAAEQEYGVCLRERIDPLIVGVGPIEAAIGVSIALQTFALDNELPDFVVSLGSAGSRILEQGRVYQVSSVSWRDIDASALGVRKGITPFQDHPVDIPLEMRLSNFPSARLSTGSDIVTGAAYEAIDADMVDMETFAVMRTCQRFNIPLVGLRGVSDGAEELRHYDDWTSLLHVIDEGLADAVDLLDLSF